MWPIIVKCTIHHIVTTEKGETRICRVIPAGWHQTGTFQRGRQSSRSASAAENRCSCPEDNQASGQHEPSGVPYTPSQNLLHLSQPGTEKHFFKWQPIIGNERKPTSAVKYHFCIENINFNRINLPLTGWKDQGCVFQYVGFSRTMPGSPKTWRCGPGNSASLWFPP